MKRKKSLLRIRLPDENEASRSLRRKGKTILALKIYLNPFG